MKVSKKLVLALGCCAAITVSLTGCSLFECKHEETVTENQATATCSNPGYTGDVKCAECGEVLTAGMSVAALEHQTTTSNAKEATCKEEGYTGDSICDVCGTTVVQGEIIAVLQHNGEKINEKEATCQEPGYSGDMKCTLCEEVYERGAVVDVVDHEWNEIEVQQEATCKQEGKHTVQCRFCEATMDEKIAKLEHQIVTDPSVEATCTTAGKTEGKRCAVCKTVIQEQSVIKALGHDIVTTTKGTDATCTKDGKESVSRCQRCNEQLTNGETIKASGHKEVKTDAVAATCSAPGKTEGSSCSVCKTVIKESTSIPALGHKSVATAEVAATCTTAGSRGGTTCSTCKAVLSEPTKIDALGHKPEIKDKVEATCAKEGYTGDKVCTTCNETIEKGTEIAKIEHTIRDVGNAVAPTCTEVGRTSDKICTACQTVVEAGTEVPMIDHEWVEQMDTAVESTCTEYGHENNFKCRLCQEEKEGERTAKKAHTRVDDPTTAIEATCQEGGKRADVICEVCKKTISIGRNTKKVKCSAIDADDAVESTCTVAGKTNSQICKWCGETMKEGTALPLAPHTEAVREAVPATCTQTGKTSEKYCSVCDTILEKATIVDVLPHTPVKLGEDVAATCTSTGIVYGTKCDDCGAPLTETTELPILPHDYTNPDRILSVEIDFETLETAQVVIQCRDCLENKTFDGVISNVEVTKESTCEEKGAITYTLTVKVSEDDVCVAENSVSATPLAPHTSDVTPGKAPTCTEDGLSNYIACSVCGEVQQEAETIPARHVNYQVDNYAWDTEFNTDNCHGTLYCTCSDCGEAFTHRVRILETISTKDATCTEGGKIIYNTKVESDKFTEDYFELEKLSDALNHLVSFPTIDVLGGSLPPFDLQKSEIYFMLTCEDCGEEMKYLCDASITTDEEPTCTETGKMTMTWGYNSSDKLRIKKEMTEGSVVRTLAKLGHIYDNPENPALCTRCETYKSLGVDADGNWWKAADEKHIKGMVKTLVIQKEALKEDEYIDAWIIDRDNEGTLMAYVVSEETDEDGLKTNVVISTMGADKLYLDTDGEFLRDFVCLTSIEGLEFVDIANCKTLRYTFKGCGNLQTLDLTHWVPSEEIELFRTFNDCQSLTTIKTSYEFAQKAIASIRDFDGNKEESVFLNCFFLKGTQTQGEEVVAEHSINADNVGGSAAKLYFTYEIPEDVE